MPLDWKIFTKRPYIKSLSLEEQMRLFSIENEKSIKLRESKFIDFANSNPTSQGAAGDGATGVVGFTNTRSLAFDSVDDHVDTNSVKFSGASSLSISCWFNINAIRNINSLMTNWNSGQTNYILRYNQGVGFQFYVSTTDTVAALTTYAITPDTDRWYHIAGIYNGSNITLYLDGAPVGTPTSLTGTVLTNTNTDVIAKRDSEFFNGNIDEVAYFTSDQTSNIATLYNGGVPGDIASLNPVAWYRFEEGSGTTAIDSGTGASNGTHSATYSTAVPT